VSLLLRLFGVRPDPPEPVELCPSCGRPRPKKRGAWNPRFDKTPADRFLDDEITAAEFVRLVEAEPATDG
jgi:hypothetical protein